MLKTHQHWMQLALGQAKLAELEGEVPVGAVVVKDNQLIAAGYNQPIKTHDATAHAEIVALRAAGEVLNNYRLVDCTLYVTIEPCAMCAGAITHARIKSLVYGASDPKAGACGTALSVLNHSQLNHQVTVVSGILAQQSSELIKAFFKKKR